MSEDLTYAVIALSAADAYALMLAMCAENKYKITRQDSAAGAVHFRPWGYTADFVASFADLGPEKCRMTASFNHSGIADYTQLLQNSVVEPFMQKVNVKMVEAAQTRLAGVPREQILHPELPVTPEVAKWLGDLENGPSVFGRREAARALGKLSETNQRITAALILAREADAHDDVRSDAAEALKSPVHQALLEQAPEWASQVLALSKMSKVEVIQKQVQTQQTNRANQNSGRNTLITGGIMAFWGLVALIVPGMGYHVILVGSIPVDQIGGGILLLLGVIVAIVGYRQME